MRPCQAIIFDMDGVIVDSEPIHERAVFQLVDELGYTGRHGIHFADYLGRADSELWRDFVARHRPPWSVQELLDRKRRKTLDILKAERPIFPHIPDLLADLAAALPLAVASGSEPEVIETVLGLCDLRRHFRTTVSAVEVRSGKPAPDIYLLTAQRLGIDPRHCVAVEDSLHGVTAALAAGMRVAAVTTTYPAEALHQATWIAKTGDELRAILSKTAENLTAKNAKNT